MWLKSTSFHFISLTPYKIDDNHQDFGVHQFQEEKLCWK